MENSVFYRGSDKSTKDRGSADMSGILARAENHFFARVFVRALIFILTVVDEHFYVHDVTVLEKLKM